MIQRYLLIWLTLSSLLAFFWPTPFVLSSPGLSSVIAVAMFAIGSLLPRNEFRLVLKHWPTVLTGTMVQYLVMPLLAWLIVSVYPFSPGIKVGILMAGCVPGAMASNILTHKAGGNVSFSISLTTSATLLCPLVVPWMLYFVLGKLIAFDPWMLFRDLILTVVGPVLLGHALSRSFVSIRGVMNKLGVPLANLAILWIVATVVALQRDQLQAIPGILLAFLIALNLCGYLAGYGAGKAFRFPEDKRRALTLEVGMQNAGLGAVLATKHFPDLSEAAIAPAAYTFGCMLTGTVLAHFWSQNRSGNSTSESD
ncbi:Sodium Bile acid symporter family protein [Polystyrenella longa]|uniref:Sodium Bile acid symporter family protein n=1 Tax=Polystyrenella longa TaxID=2528007 RepID=A0A518CK14_9PLAN|nr:bile acid:sodium symporter family protein [Polystyrenella longa]QDU79569.1 Sodium Bile acid symporter family protein [Polystyrenella longa]